MLFAFRIIDIKLFGWVEKYKLTNPENELKD